MESTNTLRVLLNDTPIGTLNLNRNDGGEFRLLESYKRAYPRPVLGQQFLDDLEQVHTSRSRVPPWFSNLLPEGPLRDLVAKQAGVASTREFFLLHRLGEDLPGAVRIVEDDILIEPQAELNAQTLEQEPAGAWHFSLAGVQLKFSARRKDRGLTIPVSGQGGDWIVKLPDSRYPKVPENEYATMLWAKASGIDIPELELINLSDINGLPADAGTFSEHFALAIRRFDRPVTGRRVHMEDFAQILGLYPEEKYQKYNYETLAKLILALTGETGLEKFIRRLIFILVSGNGDAHHKNWSLLYPDGVKAELSPAYDLLSTIQYMRDDQLALNLAKSKRWEDVGMDSFRRMARKIGYAEQSMVEGVQASLDAILTAWQNLNGDLGYDSTQRNTIESHFRKILLYRKN
ncbi:type II toxin-antitoxin system HipA family toxin [Methylomonas fluvii]|uniref:Type II toxin-antitoxin system HipA family toxin n=1 Tax=Methylomonas fluvii TaxID=1854564 RepID=A0ABR9DI49_9GAMM|nr:type II toxin-antitoxin system HipA family toxin [Methylomonas fluvii]MBD9362556.1 type II toxin-antitoxin system HipA family toxin [Methylomonas fluvii]CAD6875668.1 Toxin HigB / Protein kinase domain of HipA [Methylomonas fluvii]